jgi:hypothetical protein
MWTTPQGLAEPYPPGLGLQHHLPLQRRRQFEHPRAALEVVDPGDAEFVGLLAGPANSDDLRNEDLRNKDRGRAPCDQSACLRLSPLLHG